MENQPDVNNWCRSSLKICFLLIVLFWGFQSSSKAQILNSISADEHGIYYVAFDSLTKLLNQDYKIQRIVLQADWNIIHNFPDTVNGIRILKDNEPIKIKKLKEHDILVDIGNVSLVRDEISVSIRTWEKRDRGLGLFADVGYIFYFKFAPEEREYTLIKLKRGARL